MTERVLIYVDNLAMALDDMQNFYTWFKSHNGQLDTSLMDVIHLPASEGGRGAVALKDIPVSLV